RPSPGQDEERTVAPRMAVVSQVAFSPILRAGASHQGRPFSVLRFPESPPRWVRSLGPDFACVPVLRSRPPPAAGTDFVPPCRGRRGLLTWFQVGGRAPRSRPGVERSSARSSRILHSPGSPRSRRLWMRRQVILPASRGRADALPAVAIRPQQDLPR